MPADVAGTSYAALISSKLAEERLTKNSLESRGLSVVTTAGTLVSLLFALVALVTKGDAYHLPGFSRAALVVAMPCFVLAAFSGLVINMPRNYREVVVPALEKLVEPQFFEGSPSVGKRRSAEVEVEILKSGRNVNADKAKLLTAAIALEVLAVTLVAVALIGLL